MRGFHVECSGEWGLSQKGVNRSREVRVARSHVQMCTRVRDGWVRIRTRTTRRQFTCVFQARTEESNVTKWYELVHRGNMGTNHRVYIVSQRRQYP